MYVSLGIHHPKGSKEEAILLKSMRSFGEAQRKHAGLILTTAVKDKESGMLIGLSVWESKESFDRAWEELSISQPKRRAEEGFKFEDYEDEPHKFYSGEELT